MPARNENYFLNCKSSNLGPLEYRDNLRFAVAGKLLIKLVKTPKNCPEFNSSNCSKAQVMPNQVGFN